MIQLWGTMNRAGIRKAFKKGRNRSDLERLNLLADWLSDALIGIGKSGNLGARLKMLDVEASSFNSRSISNGYHLDDDWFRCAVAQMVPHELTRVLFEELEWDYEESFNPMFNETRTVETFIVSEEKDVKLRLPLTQTSHAPIGSRWEHKRTGAIWQVNYIYEENSLVELESGIRGFITKMQVNELQKKYWRLS